MICPYCQQEITFEQTQDREVVLAGESGGELSHTACVEHQKEEAEE